jgi:regulatory protein
VRWLVGLGYLDDAAYAAARARALLGSGRAGPLLAERRLSGAGIPAERAREAVAAALAEVAGAGGGEGEARLCRALAERRAGTAELDGLGERDRARMARWLVGRGFSGAAVARTLGVYEDR